jgi:pimeloyl-ACP methyl ester carboxylesterase
MASPKGTLDCVTSWGTDFREDLKKIKIPTLVIHGDADRIVPLSSSARRMPDFVKGARLVVLKDAPHGFNWTHAEEANKELVGFLK